MKAGSSPHAWGTPRRRSFWSSRYRFIPTRMGNTASTLLTRLIPAVHPHTHGEHNSTRTIMLLPLGSSPHAWGTRSMAWTPLWASRFIPTRMGNTSRRRCRRWPPSVHPHTHGEHTICALCKWLDYGSSPHAWGTRIRAISPRRYSRFIPTRMGNTY